MFWYPVWPIQHHYTSQKRNFQMFCRKNYSLKKLKIKNEFSKILIVYFPLSKMQLFTSLLKSIHPAVHMYIPLGCTYCITLPALHITMSTLHITLPALHTYIPAGFTYNLACVTYNPACVTFNLACVTCNLACVTNNTACVTYNHVYVTYNFTCVTYIHSCRLYI